MGKRESNLACDATWTRHYLISLILSCTLPPSRTANPYITSPADPWAVHGPLEGLGRCLLRLSLTDHLHSKVSLAQLQRPFYSISLSDFLGLRLSDTI